MIEKSHRMPEEFGIILSILIECVKSVPLEGLKGFRDRAESFSTDPKDVPYCALALKLGCPIWSRDKKLKEEQSEVKILTAEELLKML